MTQLQGRDPEDPRPIRLTSDGPMTQQPNSVAYWIAIWFGVGLARVAPGTWATLAAWPLHWVLSTMEPALHVGLILALTILAVWSAGQVAAALGNDDPQVVVIDEIVGALLALSFVRNETLFVQLGALVLFRLFDIAKPWPIDALDKARPVGLGIVSDDLLAGLVAGLAASFVVQLF